MCRFAATFSTLTGNQPFPWQTRLYERFIQGAIPSSCQIPTGLGKTAVIPIWLIALAEKPECIPRRLVYVVNRRTVVDQATNEAEKLRANLDKTPELKKLLAGLCAVPCDLPLAISTLRGQFADNGEWCSDPCRPAIVAGTVDMIGSRLLFSGYGSSFRTRPVHAGFLGQDALVVHDEAHLEPAFQELLTSIEEEQRRRHDFRPLKVMELTATPRSNSPCEARQSLADDDYSDATVVRRMDAKKGIAFYEVEKGKVADAVTDQARGHAKSNQAILIFVQLVEDAEAVVQALKKEGLKVQSLTGTLRGLERDRRVKEDSIFARFLPPSDRPKDMAVETGTVYLVCTSAGEVGINISADHLVCDLTPFDSMAQRFGRVNRFGNGDARIDIVHEPSRTRTSRVKKKKDDPFEQSRRATLDLLKQLPPRPDGRHDASPRALDDLPGQQRPKAFSPPPTISPATDILFDAWALTTIRQALPGRPPVADWLHGKRSWEPPETYVAWRQEVELIKGELLEKYPPEDLLDDYPLKPHERLRDRTDRICEKLEKIADKHPDSPVWLVEDQGSVKPSLTLEALVGEHKKYLEGRTVLLPPSVGGLEEGQLSGSAGPSSDGSEDVADLWFEKDQQHPRRKRIWDNEPVPEEMQLVRTIDTRADADDEDDADGDSSTPRFWHWYVQPQFAEDDRRSSRRPVCLSGHTDDVERRIACFADKLRLGALCKALALAAKAHDYGKTREVWQRGIGNPDPSQPWAKSGGRYKPRDLCPDYRHEFGSLLDAQRETWFGDLSDDDKDLILHLVAAHHGYARPHFPEVKAFDVLGDGKAALAMAIEVPRRFARLQRKYGRWGLAYLESLLRAADYAASAAPSAFVEKAEESVS